MDLDNTASVLEVTAFCVNIIGLLILYRLKEIISVQSESIETSKLGTRERELLQLALNRHIRCILNRALIHVILGIFSCWMLWRENINSTFVIWFNVALFLLAVSSIIMSILDILGERAMNRIVEK